LFNPAKECYVVTLVIARELFNPTKECYVVTLVTARDLFNDRNTVAMEATLATQMDLAHFFVYKFLPLSWGPVLGEAPVGDLLGCVISVAE
jgi:hypothetical protein